MCVIKLFVDQIYAPKHSSKALLVKVVLELKIVTCTEISYFPNQWSCNTRTKPAAKYWFPIALMLPFSAIINAIIDYASLTNLEDKYSFKMKS